MRTRQTAKLALVGVAAFVLAALIGATGVGQDLQSQLQQSATAENVHHREGVLSTTIQQYGDQIDHLIGEISVLRNREAIVQKQLDKVQAEPRDRIRPDQLPPAEPLLNTLRNRLVDIYVSGQPDLPTVMLDAHGFNDLIDRHEYLKRSRHRTRRGRSRSICSNESIDIVKRADRRARRHRRPRRRARAHAQRLESRQSALDNARPPRRALIRQEHGGRPRGRHLEARADRCPGHRRPAGGGRRRARGPFRGEARPVHLAGERAGRVAVRAAQHQRRLREPPGIDIAVPSGTPIHAAANGVVYFFTQLAGWTGGYGNYTCIDHGSGISTCYAHQSSFAVSQGQEVQQGDVIGISDCTGYCFGPHLHFEVRINGQVTDPMAYLP
jgi:murein DD-endopeptidase MepM/ murein hydrolase activator NlpD